MIDLQEQNILSEYRASSKGNQLKGYQNDIWYKADYMGYEGLVEYMVSALLRFSSLDEGEYVIYETEEISYRNHTYFGCRSNNFLGGGWQLITLERLFQNYYGKSLNRSLYEIPEHEERLRFLVMQTEKITGLKDFGKYMAKLMTIDAFFLNEDRHTHNIGVLFNGEDKYQYCPIFDNGAGLLADTAMDYPLEDETDDLIEHVEAKTFCRSFDEQLDISEQLYGQQIRFCFDDKTVELLLDQERYYSSLQKKRVRDIILRQKRKYRYLFR